MRLLLFNLVTDDADPDLGFAANWIRHLALRCERVDVLTMYQGEADLPQNVTVFSVGRERGWSKARRVIQFYRRLARLLSARPYDACFAHMMPLFAGLGGPLLKARGIPITLWYTHRQVSLQLRLGLFMSTRVVSPVESSFPLATSRLRLTGHGIDTDFFSPSPKSSRDPSEKPLVMQVGRLTAIKHQATTIRAIADTGAELALIGGVPDGYSDAYARELKALSLALDVQDRCHFVGALGQAAARDSCRRATVSVNTTGAGSFDKAALESMACGIPTIVSHDAFAPLLGDYQELLTIDGPQDVAGLRDRLNQLFDMSAAERDEIGLSLRYAVIRQHSLKRLINNLMAIFQTGELPSG